MASSCSSTDTMAPSARVCWLRLRGMPVFWPGCVYESFSAATRHALDTQRLRQAKPVMDDEDRLVVFFGVHSSAGTAAISSHTRVVPSLRLSVVPQDEITAARWTRPQDFTSVCRDHNVAEEAIVRAAQTSVFGRACEEATRFYEEAKDDAAASRLFVRFFTGVRARVSGDYQPTLKADETAKSVRKESKPALADKSNTPASKPVPAAKSIPVQSNQQQDSLPIELARTCWPMMEAAGWTTFSQPDGGELYAMPGVQFFEVRPYVTVFDSLATACGQFLRVWTTSGSHTSSPLNDTLWTLMAARGWQTISAADGVLYVMPNTPFDRFVPNVTIFKSKPHAMAKFVDELLGADVQSPVSSSRADSEPEAEATTAASDVDVDADEDMASSVDEEESGHSGSEEEEGEGDEEEELPIKFTRRPANVPEKRSISGPTRRKPSVLRRAPPPVAVPPFKCTQGKLEKALSARGWFWKRVAVKTALDGYMYFKPHCKGTLASELVVGRDCFAGFLGLETYLEDSGLYVEIVDSLRREHERAYLQSLPPAPPAVTTMPVVRKRAAPPAVKRPSAAAAVIEISDEGDDSDDAPLRKAQTNKKAKGAARRKPAAAQIRRVQPPNPTRRGPPISQARRIPPTQSVPFKVPFGVVWAKLAQKGWYYRPGRFEYDYFTPTAKRKKDLVHGEDVFYSKDELEEYLEISGLKARIEAEIRRRDEGDDSQASEEELPGPEESMEEQELVVETTPVKRKASSVEDDESVDTPVAKKPKQGSTRPLPDAFQTPPSERSKRPVELDDNDGSENDDDHNRDDEFPATQELSTLPLDSAQNISPENAPSKARQEDGAKATTPLSRNLRDAFTPSPRADKRAKQPEQTAVALQETVQLSPHALAERSIVRLSLGYLPQVFSHREAEAAKIEAFCRGCIAARRGGSMYLSGAPGCGKSALLRSLIDKIGDLNESPRPIVPVHVNAMGLSDFSQLYCQVAENLTGKAFTHGDDAWEAIERGTATAYKRSKTLLLVLDEIDALGKTSMEGELCRLFELAHRPGHAFILVGIANQIDFTERHLALLRLQLPHIKPHVVVFKPYSYQTISDILLERLGGLADASRIVNAHGVSFIARKVAAQSGDVRLALNICRRVLEQKLGDVAANSSGGHSGVCSDYGPPISLIDIVKTIKVVLEGKSRSNVSSLPRNLQMILFASTRLVAQTTCVVDAAPTSTSDAGVTHKLYRVDDLYACYCDVSHDAGVFKPLTRGEFKLGLETLSSEGMIGATELKKQLLKLLCTPSELLQTFKHDAYFSRLI